MTAEPKYKDQFTAIKKPSRRVEVVACRGGKIVYRAVRDGSYRRTHELPLARFYAMYERAAGVR